MKWPRARFTVGRMMVLVAIAALVFELDAVRRRHPYCRSHAARCDRAKEFHLAMAKSHERLSMLYRRHAANPEESRRYNDEQAVFFTRFGRTERARARDAARRANAFRRAAIYPWVAIPEAEPAPVPLVPIPTAAPEPERIEQRPGSNRFVGSS